MRKFLIASVAVAAVALGGCRMAEISNQSGSSAEAPAGDWPAFVNGFIEASFKANPGFAVAQGRHEYDGQIADLSQAAIDGEVARLKKAISDAEAFGDDKLTDEQKYERDYLVAVAKGQLFWIDPAGADQLHNNPAAYLGMLDPSVYITVPYAPKEQRLKAYIKFLENIPRAAEQMRDQHQDADGDQLRRLCQVGVRRFRRILSGRRNGRLEGRRHGRGPEGAEGRERQCGQGDDGNRRLGRKPALRRKAQFRARQGQVPAHARRHRNGDDAGRASWSRSAAPTLPPTRSCWARPARVTRPARRSGVHGKDEREQAQGRRRAGGPGAARGPEAVHHRPGHRDHPGAGRSQGRGSAALQPAELRLHQHSRAVREGPAVGLLHRAARPDLVEGEQDALRSGPGRPPVHLGPRGMAGPLPQLPPRQPVEEHVRPDLRRLRLRGRLGALHRGDDARRLASAAGPTRR